MVARENIPSNPLAQCLPSVGGARLPFPCWVPSAGKAPSHLTYPIHTSLTAKRTQAGPALATAAAERRGRARLLMRSLSLSSSVCFVFVLPLLEEPCYYLCCCLGPDCVLGIIFEPPHRQLPCLEILSCQSRSFHKSVPNTHCVWARGQYVLHVGAAPRTTQAAFRFCVPAGSILCISSQRERLQSQLHQCPIFY